MTTAPAGYAYDTDLAPAPVTQQQLHELLTDVMWSDADAAALRRAGDILEPQVADVLDA